MRTRMVGRSLAVAVGVWVGAAVAVGGEELSRTAGAVGDPAVFVEREGTVRAVGEGPGGAAVLRIGAPFSGRIDLKTAAVEPGRFDLLKLAVKADGRPWIRVSLENHPRPGELSHWYAYSGTQGPFDWRTLWIDLHRPEEIKPAGSYKGMAEADPSARGLRIEVTDRSAPAGGEEAGRSVWLGPVRFVRKAVDLDWDQRAAPCAREAGGDLVFRYSLQVTNRLDRPVTALLRLEPIEHKHARATLSREKVALAGGAGTTVEAVLRLPAEAARSAGPLYCERFLALAEAEGLPDTQVTILRSSDPVALTATVPLEEARLKFPLLPRRRDLPESVTGFSRRERDAAAKLAEEARPEDLRECLAAAGEGKRGFGLSEPGGIGPAQRYQDGLTAAAFLYDATGERKYLEKGTALLKAAAELFPRLQEQWARQPATMISHGVFAFNTLRLGWVTGSMRSPYAYSRHGMFNDFDLLAAGMDARDRRQIIDGFIVPAAIQMRNHTFGLGNQQDVVNYAILYAGLAGRNWPLASFAYSGDYGLLNQLKLDFSVDGLAGEGNYHVPAIRPILYVAELLGPAGVDLYNDRLYLVTHSPAAEAIGKAFHDPILAYVEEHRFKGKALRPIEGKDDGLHLRTGVTSLRWKGLEVSMNWGTQMNRGAPDRCALRITAPESHPLNNVGGGNYTHSSLGQSILILDEGRQVPVPARVTGYDIHGPVQFVQAVSDRHYGGSTITRTFALLEDIVLVVDRVVGDRPRTVDWCLRYAGGRQTHEDVAKAVALEMRHREGSFTAKPGDAAGGVNFGGHLKSGGYFSATTGKAWRQANGHMTMAAGAGTEVMVFAVPAAFSAWKKERETGVPLLMVRRKGVSRTDYVAALSPRVQAVEQAPVTRADGKGAEAIGVTLRLADGRTVRAIVNYEPEGVEVASGGLRTKARFASDFSPGG